MIDVNETYYAEEAQYSMPYHELEDIVRFLHKIGVSRLPQSIKDNVDKWEDFLAENY